MEAAAARGDRYGTLLDVARRGGRDSSLQLHERLGDWWAELNQLESFVARHQEERRAAEEPEDGAMEWEDWDGADQDHDGGGRARADPASRKAMAALLVPAVGETREQGCAVCLEDFVTGGGELRTMPCSHSFHRRCIFDWLLVNRRCPMCRFELPSRTEDDGDEERELVAE
ncbi:hypothetical protein QYE76_003585 [Lolium multiflorum]|uniref:RING-type domain-containing protein n=1 Tax=Lolium multiflorum TaxID=4521 RepID=A0AAD8RPL1_LOLMU|nr:hypothetical protein QYE76_003585 [Lolium multiflorum]